MLYGISVFVVGATSYNSAACQERLAYFSGVVNDIVVPMKSPLLFEHISGDKYWAGNDWRDLQQVGYAISDNDEGMTMLAKSWKRDELVLVKQTRGISRDWNDAKLGGLPFQREHDPLIGEYAFAKVLEDMNIAPQILWISDIGTDSVGASRTVLEEPVGMSMREYVDSKLEVESSPLEILEAILHIVTKGFDLIKKLHHQGIVHGQMHWEDLVFAENEEKLNSDSVLALTDFKFATFMCHADPNGVNSQYMFQWLPHALAMRGMGFSHDLYTFGRDWWFILNRVMEKYPTSRIYYRVLQNLKSAFFVHHQKLTHKMFEHLLNEYKSFMNQFVMPRRKIAAQIRD